MAETNVSAKSANKLRKFGAFLAAVRGKNGAQFVHGGGNGALGQERGVESFVLGESSEEGEGFVEVLAAEGGDGSGAVCDFCCGLGGVW